MNKLKSILIITLALCANILSVQALEGDFEVQIEEKDGIEFITVNHKADFISHIGLEPQTQLKYTHQLQHILESYLSINKPSNGTLIELFSLLFYTDLMSTDEKATWIEANNSKLPAPFLMLLALFKYNTDPQEALKYYYVGLIRATIDTEKCLDKSVSAAIGVLQYTFLIESAYPSNVSGLKARANAIKKAIQWHKENPNEIIEPYYVLYHGMGLYFGIIDSTDPESNFEPQDTWPEIEEYAINKYLMYKQACIDAVKSTLYYKAETYFKSWFPEGVFAKDEL